MTREFVSQRLYELQHLVRQREEVRRQLASFDMNQQVASAMKDPKRVEEFVNARQQARKTLEAMENVLQERANLPSERALGLVSALEARMGAYEQQLGELAEMEAGFELAVSSGELEDLEMRKKAEEMLSARRQRVERQLELAGKLLPEKAVLLTV